MVAELPYARSTAGQGREKEIRETLRSVGASAVGFMVDDEAEQILCQFRLNGRTVTIPISVKAYEAAWLRTYQRGPRIDVIAHYAKAKAQAQIAVWAILADWVKAQAAMMAGGLMDADTAFLSHIHTSDGRRVVEVVMDASGPLALPKPAAPVERHK